MSNPSSLKNSHFVISVALVFAAVGIPSYFQKRDSIAVQEKDAPQLSMPFLAQFQLSVTPSESLDGTPSNTIIVVTSGDDHEVATFRMTGDARTPLQKRDGTSSEFNDAASLSAIYRATCDVLAQYKKTPALFSTSRDVIAEVQERDIQVYRALRLCPMSMRYARP